MILSILFYVVFFTFTLIYFVTMCVAFVLTAAFDRNRVVLHWLSKVWAMCYFKFVPTWKLEVEGKENIDKSQTYVIIVNHRSMIDIILMYVLPLEFKWVAKKEVYRWPLFGWVMRLHGDIGVERGAAGSVRKMIRDGGKWLGRGVSLIIFPEGSRSKTGDINKFKEGAFMMAKQTGVSILPCVTLGTGTILKRGWRLNFRNRYYVKILPPVSAEEVQAADTKELAQRMRHLIVEEHAKLKELNRS